MRAMWRMLALAIALSLAGCGDDEAPAAVPGRGVGPEAAAPAAPATEPVKTSRRYGSAAEARPQLGPAPTDPIQIVENVPVPAEQQQAPRDLGAELQRAIGDPTACFDRAALANAGPTLSIAVSATVTSSGMITRAEASAPGMPAESIACVRDRVLAARLAPPIADAPRTIGANLRYDVRPATPPAPAPR